MAKAYSEKLFLINDKTNTLELNKFEIREEKAFKEILERDKGGKVKGDADGRKKYFAYKEFYYIYIMADPFSMFSILNEERRHKQAMESSGLIEIEGWKPDKLIKEAIIAYKELIPLSALAYTYLNARKALYNLGQDIELFNTYSDDIRKQINIARNELNGTDIDGKTYTEDIQRSKSKINSLMEQLSKLSSEVLNITNNLPTRIDGLEKLKVKLSEEDNEREEIVGGGTVYGREDA